MYTWDKAAARESLKRILSWDIKQAIIAHGEILTGDVKGTIRKAYALFDAK